MKTSGTSSREHDLATMLLLGEHHVDVVVAKTWWRLLACMATNLAKVAIQSGFVIFNYYVETKTRKEDTDQLVINFSEAQ